MVEGVIEGVVRGSGMWWEGKERKGKGRKGKGREGKENEEQKKNYKLQIDETFMYISQSED